VLSLLNICGEGLLLMNFIQHIRSTFIIWQICAYYRLFTIDGKIGHHLEQNMQYQSLFKAPYKVIIQLKSLMKNTFLKILNILRDVWDFRLYLIENLSIFQALVQDY